MRRAQQAMRPPRDQQPAQCQHRVSNEVRIGEGQRMRTRFTNQRKAVDEGAGSKQLHGHTKQLPDQALLPGCQPEHTSTFDRPDRCGHAAVHRQRHCQRRENQRQSGVAHCQPLRHVSGGCGRPAAHKQRQQQIDRTGGNGGDGGAVFEMFNQLRLQQEAHDRRAENHDAIEHPLAIARVAQRVEQTDKHIDGEKGNQERLRGGVVLWHILECTPQRRHPECCKEAEQVERPPRP